MTSKALEREFDKEMMNIYHRARDEAEYRPTLFLNMLHERGGKGTAVALIHSKKPSEGYTALYMKGRLDLTVEAVVTDNPKWHPLFNPETLELARKRLKEYEYKSK